MDTSFSMAAYNAETCFSKDIPGELLDSPEIHPMDDNDDDDALSLFGDGEIEETGHCGNRRQNDHDTGDICPKDKSGMEEEEELMSLDVFLESIDSSTSMMAPKGPPGLPKLATLLHDRCKTEL